MINKPDGFRPYKFRDLKVYASKENLVDDKKKYRQVFSVQEVSFIYAEFSFFNKLFDEEDWEIDCQLKAFEHTGRQICNIDVRQTVSLDDNIVYIRQGWGVDDPGAFWIPGTYYWEVWIQGQKADTSTYFYIIDAGSVKEGENPYFEITSLRLYEAGHDDLPKDERTYYSVFDKNETRYVWVEFEAENLLKTQDVPWPCELYFNFYSDTGQLKGFNHELLIVGAGQETIAANVGWGSRKVGSWYADDYKLEVVFMDKVIAVMPFSSQDYAEEATEEQTYYLPSSAVMLRPASDYSRRQPEQDPMEALANLIGLDSVKEKVKEYLAYLNFVQIRNEKGLEKEEKPNLHSVYVGNPGTGKTTVANLMGRIYKDLGLLSRGHVYEVDRSHLVGEYIGQTAPKVKEAITKARGGILFIDEAYSLARKSDDAKDYGREVIEILLKEMSDGPGDLAVVVAGYPEEMQFFMDSNPGLRSRFGQIFHFADYTPQELILISEYTSERRGVLLNAEARERLYDELVRKYRNRDRSFGNARLVNSLIDAAKMNLGLRLMQTGALDTLDTETLSTITLDDMDRIFMTNSAKIADIPVDEAPLKHDLHELMNLTGLLGIKSEIEEMVQLVRFYREIGKNVRDEFNLHTIFLGNPGTGKTTVARLIARIYKHLGVLERGHLVECDRQQLVAGYVGQTAEKTDALIQQAMGGVLFVDEAYSLQQGNDDAFGKEAIATLLKRMEDNRGEFVVIVAGYPNEMDAFLNSNPGLRSRFDKKFVFDDYGVEDLLEIAQGILSKDSMRASDEALQHLRSYLTVLSDSRDKYFGNARSVRKIVEKAIKNQHLRLARMPATERKPDMLRTLEVADVQEFDVAAVSRGRVGSIGFQQQQREG